MQKITARMGACLTQTPVVCRQQYPGFADHSFSFNETGRDGANLVALSQTRLTAVLNG